VKQSLKVSCKNVVSGEAVSLPASKSISNRALILNALSGNRSTVSNLSEARDTSLMQHLLASPDKVADAKDAGTTMRFLTAYFAATHQKKLLTGTDRMKQRPIGPLVNALKELGVAIDYTEKEGFPPFEIKSFDKQLTDVISIAGNVSSQYISALMMIGPTLPRGLILHLQGKVGSRPYIQMTASMMADFGVQCQWNGNTLELQPPQPYHPANFTVESDWSAASYWFSIVALARKGEIVLSNMTIPSLQGDSIIVKIMDRLGVQATFKGNTATLTKKSHASSIEWDFTDCPDLAQTVLPVCAVKNITGIFTGLESLRIKESDRIAALQTELAKVGAKISEAGEGRWRIDPDFKPARDIVFSTYHDHRMAMGLAPMATLVDIEIENPEVVNKSYPGFWKDLSERGFSIS
jgi:3-phosphoshikimate 1-carboxyvinyltransferase